ncbi:MAG: YebC/PmpR family DNA-binding transcriptional regulator [Rhodospirillaceae bacterium]|nr:YebC/PmpR family DNA-binding transcriptional regulator [Rhodospirillaceae bacterium]|tara:strand:- start:820 stop:1566 length:747 start_codon:yes stop_codon:yes gene_type:complete
MAGHSKWANIRFRKGAQDAKRGKLFTKLIREITVAAREAGGDPASNPRLRTAIEKAKSQSMPKDNIDRAVKRGTGDMDGAVYEEVRYEGYGPGGAAVMVDCLTDNRNRTVAEVRHAFTKFGGNLGADGSVSYLFEKVGFMAYAADVEEEQLMEAAIDAGAQDVLSQRDGSVEVLCIPEEFESVRDSMIAVGLIPEHAEVTMKASTQAQLEAKQAESMLKLLDTLDELDDTQQVYSNADLPGDLLEDES